MFERGLNSSNCQAATGKQAGSKQASKTYIVPWEEGTISEYKQQEAELGIGQASQSTIDRGGNHIGEENQHGKLVDHKNGYEGQNIQTRITIIVENIFQCMSTVDTNKT